MQNIVSFIGLFCKTFAKETYHFIDPTCRSHPIKESDCKGEGKSKERERERVRVRARKDARGKEGGHVRERGVR